MEGVVRGERYKKTPEIVDGSLKRMESLPSQGKGFLFRRWDNPGTDDRPEVVIFFARPEVLSGLFILANYDSVDPDGVICPFGPGAVPSSTTSGSNSRRSKARQYSACSTRRRGSALHRIFSPSPSR